MKNFSIPIRFILISSFFMAFGYFAVYAFLAIYLSNFLHFSAMQVGTILTIMTITSRVIPLFSGIIADKVGYMIMMISGLLLRGIGFICLGIFSEFHTISISASLIGFGTAFYEPAARAVFGSQPARIRKDLFTYLNLAFNSGAIIGPIAGSLLLIWNPLYPFILTGSLMLLFAVLFYLLRNHFQVSTENVQLLSGFKVVFENKHFLSFSGIMIFFYIMFTQLTVALPLHMTNISHNEKLGGIVITLNAITGVLFMIAFRKIFHKYNTLSIVKYGVLLMGISFLLIPLFQDPYWLFVCVILFTIGETLVLPNADITIANYSNESYTATYFGFYQLSLAIGFIIGNYTGTWLTSQMQGTYTPWFILGTLGVTGFILLHILKNMEQKHEKEMIHTGL
ncbi:MULTISPECIES: MDR family MFS transporter [Bacillus]|uniref:MDR family MFS transporter n=1 Tax=Bacillus TaxID=1386 RepID=UPI000305D841|nr:MULTISPECIES: MFS transporter [Bacillus]AIK36200.1 major Facilitator Superfamily protein [Bacillus pseudomycoides]AJI18606.1 major Facilitator Superfamily protein [Bacillus pseudomycoides]MCX2824405.1 MFS transporter [Bacillus sp. DHT2]MDR4915854.1 MFS transporter [Bacillus pseudomycoides]MED1594295.1 MFS transporter [Bacillus pseudomycoides]